MRALPHRRSCRERHRVDMFQYQKKTEGKRYQSIRVYMYIYMQVYGNSRKRELPHCRGGRERHRVDARRPVDRLEDAAFS